MTADIIDFRSRAKVPAAAPRYFRAGMRVREIATGKDGHILRAASNGAWEVSFWTGLKVLRDEQIEPVGHAA